MKIKNSLLFLIFLTVISCKDTKKPVSEEVINSNVDVISEFFAEYEKIEINKELANLILIDNIYIKSRENLIDETTGYQVIFDINDENSFDDILDYKLTLQLVPTEEEKSLLNDVSKERKISSEYYFIDINTTLQKAPSDDVSKFFELAGKEYVSINFNTRLNRLEYLGILLRDRNTNKYLKQNIKIKNFNL
jgi:hypothetical protein